MSLLVILVQVIVIITVAIASVYMALVFYMAHRGANYLPTPARDIATALTVLKKGDVFLDLGFGRGEVLEAALQRGAAKVVGYELDPYRFISVWLKLHRYGARVELHFADIWFADLSQANVVFTFFTVAHMPRLYLKVRSQAKKARWFISYVHQIKMVKPTKKIGKVLFFKL